MNIPLIVAVVCAIVTLFALFLLLVLWRKVDYLEQNQYHPTVSTETLKRELALCKNELNLIKKLLNENNSGVKFEIVQTSAVETVSESERSTKSLGQKTSNDPTPSVHEEISVESSRVERTSEDSSCLYVINYDAGVLRTCTQDKADFRIKLDRSELTGSLFFVGSLLDAQKKTSELFDQVCDIEGAPNTAKRFEFSPSKVEKQGQDWKVVTKGKIIFKA